MIPGIERRNTPEWLMNLSDLETLPIQYLLKESLFYPSSGRDGDPVRYLGGFVHSFIYVDYGLDRSAIWESLHDDRHGFKGYSLLGCRYVAESELSVSGMRLTPAELTREENPLRHPKNTKQPFAIWTVQERSRNYGEEHGPERFSLLYICADGAAAFRALYYGNQCTPEVIAIVQSGEGWGGNWTDFRDPNRILGRLVLGNPYGRPSCLLYGGWGLDYRDCCWPHYKTLIHYWRAAYGALGLWSA